MAGLLYRDPAWELTPAGLPRGGSVYLPARDGTRIAATIWLPSDLRPGQKVPALIKGTPYWRGGALTFLGKALSELGLPIIPLEPDIGILNQRGYAVIAVDTRGTGASFGHQDILLDAPEVEDFGAIIDWTARQPWSNGRVGAYGFSYRGMLAVSMASLGRPQLRAIAPSFDFTDLYLTTYPGGVFNETFLKKWGDQTATLNRGEPPCSGVCRWLVAGPRPVDADRDGALLKAAIAEHARNYDVFACSQARDLSRRPGLFEREDDHRHLGAVPPAGDGAVSRADVRDRGLVRCNLAGRGPGPLRRLLERPAGRHRRHLARRFHEHRPLRLTQGRR